MFGYVGVGFSVGVALRHYGVLFLILYASCMLPRVRISMTVIARVNSCRLIVEREFGEALRRLELALTEQNVK